MFCFKLQSSFLQHRFTHVWASHFSFLSPERGLHRRENQVWSGERLHWQLGEEKDLRRLQRDPRVWSQRPSAGEETEQNVFVFITDHQSGLVFIQPHLLLLLGLFSLVFCHILHRLQKTKTWSWVGRLVLAAQPAGCEDTKCNFVWRICQSAHNEHTYTRAACVGKSHCLC